MPTKHMLLCIIFQTIIIIKITIIVTITAVMVYMILSYQYYNDNYNNSYKCIKSSE